MVERLAKEIIDASKILVQQLGKRRKTHKWQKLIRLSHITDGKMCLKGYFLYVNQLENYRSA